MRGGCWRMVRLYRRWLAGVPVPGQAFCVGGQWRRVGPAARNAEHRARGSRPGTLDLVSDAHRIRRDGLGASPWPVGRTGTAADDIAGLTDRFAAAERVRLFDAAFDLR